MARILVVDDSEDLQEALRDVLEAAGFEVSGALDGAQGLQMTRETHPDVILLDMMMPEMDGLAFLSRLSTQPAPPPVVAQSGFPDFRAEALRRGARAFLVKPISVEVLLNALRAAMQHRPVEPAVLAQNGSDAERARRTAGTTTTSAVSRVDRQDLEELRLGLHRITGWLPGYFGYGTSLVTVLRGASCCVEAIDGPMAAQFVEGGRYPRESFYCDDVIAAGSTLLITEARKHPVAHFAHHPAVSYGVQFYAGVPLTAPSGAVLGTLCIVDTRPHEFRTDDMRVLEALGLGAAKGLETGSWPLDEDGAFRHEYLDLFIEVAAIRAAREGGAAAEWVMEASGGRPLVPRATGLAAVRLDDHLTLLWSGPAGDWALPDQIARHARVRVEIRGGGDR